MKKLYELEPRLKKTREKIIMSVCLLVSSLCYGVSGFLLYPALYQFFAIVLLSAAVVVIVRYLLRNYVYVIHGNEDGEARELVVVEVMSKKQTVVCRISLSDVADLIPRAVFLQSNAGHGQEIYRYVSELFPEHAYFAEILQGDRKFFVEIYADSVLADLIVSNKRQDRIEL